VSVTPISGTPIKPFLLFYPTVPMEGSYRTEASASFKL
jgi:hypothetical protein